MAETPESPDFKAVFEAAAGAIFPKGECVIEGAMRSGTATITMAGVPMVSFSFNHVALPGRTGAITDITFAEQWDRKQLLAVRTEVKKALEGDGDVELPAKSSRMTITSDSNFLPYIILTAVKRILEPK